MLPLAVRRGGLQNYTPGAERAFKLMTKREREEKEDDGDDDDGFFFRPSIFIALFQSSTCGFRGGDGNGE